MLRIEIPSSIPFDGHRFLRKSPTASNKDVAKADNLPLTPTSPSSPSPLHASSPKSPLSRTLSLALSRPSSRSKPFSRSSYTADFRAFTTLYPSYKATSILDDLRKKEFERLEKSNEVYLDYMGGSLWPKSLVTKHASLLENGLFGNTHSDSPW